eukprot:CAMPEP_0175816538 /NCGR_PEP_ID=MMETSP0107_2-20121207/6547_1 /TAXON_ID=195067 ORGANISM="Goniomonas pacifica, Strain CCMP1869" /NCGR_SAMPLE_ID=MMETSP0107_2 /ASSEMBLY_ACC=CAM_ASM_000203 /LENGTH=243 /DNA_ID=CAMNT_0017128641 /DNA_START=8 /DNA_END=739 /DNA_ORIENTATION=+
MVHSFGSWYMEIPPITRWYLTLAVFTTAACFFDIISPFTIYLNYKLVYEKLEIWRLFTNFFFFGMPNLDFLFHMFFLVRYCRLLEEGSFRGRKADFFWMLMFGSSLMLLIAPFISIPFLGYSLTFLMVYVWGRRDQGQQMGFLSLFYFRAPYLPWVLLGFSMLLGGSPVVDLLGMLVGHVYYYFEDVAPNLPGTFYGCRLLRTPEFVRYLFEENTSAPDFRLQWGRGVPVGRDQEGDGNAHQD